MTGNEKVEYSQEDFGQSGNVIDSSMYKYCGCPDTAQDMRVYGTQSSQDPLINILNDPFSFYGDTMLPPQNFPGSLPGSHPETFLPDPHEGHSQTRGPANEQFVSHPGFFVPGSCHYQTPGAVDQNFVPLLYNECPKVPTSVHQGSNDITVIAFRYGASNEQFEQAMAFLRKDRNSVGTSAHLPPGKGHIYSSGKSRTECWPPFP